MPFTKGMKRPDGAGRKVGKATKVQKAKKALAELGLPIATPTELRTSVLAAYDILGGVEWLVELGRKHPKYFVPLLGKTMPTHIQGNVNHLHLDGYFVAVTDDVRAALTAGPEE